MSIRYDDRVAIVTGAGNGLGKEHALALAARGAKVVVNDLGGDRHGVGSSSAAADAVVEEIRAAGGEAIANGANVADEGQVQAMVDQTMAKWGRVDILINNAGILRDKTFAKMELDDFRLVMDVHLMGTVICTKAVWPIMREANYGRIVLTSSSSGIYGNFGQSNYGAAKSAMVGLMNVLCLEGQKNDIRVNTLAPAAATRMTEELMPPAVLELLQPEFVTPGVLYLVGEEGPNRTILSAGAGSYARIVVQETDGIFLPEGERTPEKIAEMWDTASDLGHLVEPKMAGDQTAKLLKLATDALGIDVTR